MEPRGPRIQGYTNPLWVLYMSLVHLLPIPESKTSLAVQVTGALLLACNLYFVRKIALQVSDGSEAVALGAVVLTASYFPINNWGLQGMEVSALVLIMSVCLWRALVCMRDFTFSIFLYVSLGVGIWVRPDMLIPGGALIIFLAVVDPVNRQRHLIWGSLIVASFYASQALFGWWYFGDIFPNTYYLKLMGYPEGLRITRGLYVVARFIWNANLLLFAVPFVVAVRRDSRMSLLLWMLSAQLLYDIYVGGDAWESQTGSRYICIAMPGFFVLLSYGLARASQLLVDKLYGGAGTGGLAKINWRIGIFAALIAFSMISFNAVSFNSMFGADSLIQTLLIRPPFHSGSGGENDSEVRQAFLIDRITTPHAKIAVVRAGTIPDFSNRYDVDELGKIDAHIAHEPMKVPSGLQRFIGFEPGHMKYDYDYSVGQLRPDVIAQLWAPENQIRPDVKKYHYRGVRMQGNCLYVLDGSVNVLWANLSTESCP